MTRLFSLLYTFRGYHCTTWLALNVKWFLPTLPLVYWNGKHVPPYHKQNFPLCPCPCLCLFLSILGDRVSHYSSNWAWNLGNLLHSASWVLDFQATWHHKRLTGITPGSVSWFLTVSWSLANTFLMVCFSFLIIKYHYTVLRLPISKLKMTKVFVIIVPTLFRQFFFFGQEFLPMH